MRLGGQRSVCVTACLGCVFCGWAKVISAGVNQDQETAFLVISELWDFPQRVCVCVCVSCQLGVGWNLWQRNELRKQLQFGQSWGLQPFDGDRVCVCMCVHVAFPWLICVQFLCVFAVCYLLKVCFKMGVSHMFVHVCVSLCVACDHAPFCVFYVCMCFVC